MSKKKHRKPSNNKISNLTNTILGILKKDRTQTFNYKQIAAKLVLTTRVAEIKL